MGYAIVGYFDENADKRIKTLWEGMAKAGVNDYLIKSENNPHIKFAMYEDLNLDEAKPLLENIAGKTKAIPVQFKTYSFYPNEKPFISIDVAVSSEILNLQKEIRNSCDRHAKLFHIS